MLIRNHGRLVVLESRASASDIAQMNVVRTAEDLRKIGEGVVETVLRMRQEIASNPNYIAELQALDDATPPFDFEK